MKSFESQFLCSSLRADIDSITKLNFVTVKSRLIEAMKAGSQFDSNSRHVRTMQAIQCPKNLQRAYYNFLLKAEGKGVVSEI